MAVGCRFIRKGAAMTPAPAAPLVIEVDEQIERLVLEINSVPSSSRHQGFVDSAQEVLIDGLLGPFGLSRAMLADVDGGNITTLHNFESGVVANDADRERHASWVRANSEKFDRSDYERGLPAERKKAFQQGEITDAYTGRELPKDGRAHVDHVVSAKAVEGSAIGQLAQTREDRVKTANQDDNKAWTGNSLNCSKGDSDLREWAGRPNAQDPTRSNAEFYGADEARIAEVHARAKSAVDAAQSAALLKKQASEFVRQGGLEAGKLALRRILGLCMADLARGLICDFRVLVGDGVGSAARLAAVLRHRAAATVRQLKEKWADHLKDGALVGLAGLLSSLATLLINSLVTTAKNMVTLIREGAVSLLKAIKTIVSPDPSASATDVAFAVLKILSALAITAVGLALEESIRKLIETGLPVLAPFAGEIALAVTAIATGLTTLLAVMAFDAMRDFIAYRNKQIADVHRGQSVTLLKLRQTAMFAGMAHEHRDVMTSRLLLTIDSDAAERDHADRMMASQIDDYDASVEALSSLLIRA